MDAHRPGDTDRAQLDRPCGQSAQRPAGAGEGTGRLTGLTRVSRGRRAADRSAGESGCSPCRFSERSAVPAGRRRGATACRPPIRWPPASGSPAGAITDPARVQQVLTAVAGDAESAGCARRLRDHRLHRPDQRHRGHPVQPVLLSGSSTRRRHRHSAPDLSASRAQIDELNQRMVGRDRPPVAGAAVTGMPGRTRRRQSQASPQRVSSIRCIGRRSTWRPAPTARPKAYGKPSASRARRSSPIAQTGRYAGAHHGTSNRTRHPASADMT